MILRHLPSLAVVALLAHAATLQAADPAPIELLQLPSIQLEESNGAPNELPGLKQLADNDPRSIGVGTPPEGKGLEVVYSFAGEAQFTPRKLIVRLPERMPPMASAAAIEVLASTVSPRGGFRTLGGGKLEKKAEPQEFKLQPAAARWIMLRIVPETRGGRVAVGDISITGSEGAPASEYLFAQSPAESLVVLKRLEQMKGVGVELSADEVSLFADAEDGKLDKWSFGEAALIVSGITDAKARKPLVEKLDKLAAEAKIATNPGKIPFKKGELLLKWLHTRHHLRQYSSLQTDLHPILKDGQFNCVSSALLYNILGRRLGLDLKGIEVPDHAFSILYDGSQHADVETTNKEGFAATREALADFERQTGFVYTTDHRDRREVDETGLLAMVAYNHGVAFAQEKQFPQALGAYFRAMSLDRECASAVKAALGTLANWSLALSKDEKFEDAIRVLATASELAPKDERVRSNRIAVWRMWAQAEAKANRKTEALALLRRAKEDLRDEDFADAEMWVYAARGEELAKANDWEGALKAIEPGFSKLTGKALEDLVVWRNGLLGRWFNTHLKEGNFDAAADAIQRAVTLVPDDKLFANNLAYLAQEWSRKARQEGKTLEGEQALAKLIAKHPKVLALRQAAQSHYFHLVDDLARQEKFAEAIAAAERSRELLNEGEAIRKLQVHAYDAWAAQFRKKMEWRKSLDIYAKALETLPKDPTLVNNEQATWFGWADSYMKDKKWAMAIEIYEMALLRYPGNSSFENNIKYCKQEAGLKE